MPIALKIVLFILFLSASFKSVCETIDVQEGVSITPTDISKAAIAFINISTSPGIDTSQISVDTAGLRQTSILRTSFGFSTDFSIHDNVLDGYVGASFVSASLKDDLIVNYNKRPDVRVNLTRDIVALQTLSGFSIPVTKNLIFKPYVSLVVSQFDNLSEISNSASTQPVSRDISFSSQTEAFTLAGTMEFNYLNQWNNQTIEADFKYSATTTETFDDINELLNTEGNVHTLVFNSRWAIPTSLKSNGIPWNFSTFYNHVNFLNHTSNSLGFDYYHELGVGLDYQLNIKPMNWLFAFRYVGIKASTLFGDDVEGYSVEFYFR